jgi:excisionase family DNA binding protein
MLTKRPQERQSDFPERLLYSEAAEYLRCSVTGLRKKVMYGQIPHLKPFGVRGRVLFLRSDLEKFLETHRVPAEAAG